jgi:carbon-monoxide dehydrogenase large subunit
MDDIARRLHIDPLELRLKNLVHEGDTFVTGERLVAVGVEECLTQVAATLDWSAGQSDRPIPTGQPGIVRGKGLACMIKSTVTPSNAAASVRLNADGSVHLLTSSPELGQGPTTALAQIVAETLGVSVERVSVSLPDTDFTPYDQGALSSRTIFFMGNAVVRATRQVRQQVLEAAAEKLEAAVEDLDIEDGVVHVKGARDRRMTFQQVFAAKFGTAVGSLFGSYDFQTSGGLHPDTGKGKASDFWFFSAAGAEVEVDTETGKVRVLRALTAVDVGRALSPRQCWLQNEGSMLTALGTALFEELAFDNGQPINASFLDYMLPSMEDYPEEFRSLLVENPHPEGPYGAKGIGEAALGPVAPAIGNAAANALGGARVKDLPIRPDRVLEVVNASAQPQLDQRTGGRQPTTASRLAPNP